MKRAQRRARAAARVTARGIGVARAARLRRRRCRCCCPSARGRDVALVGVEQVAGDLGRLAEADRQQAGGQRIEAAGVAGLLGAEQARRCCSAWLEDRPSGLSSSRMPSSFALRGLSAAQSGGSASLVVAGRRRGLRVVRAIGARRASARSHAVAPRAAAIVVVEVQLGTWRSCSALAQLVAQLAGSAVQALHRLRELARPRRAR